MEDQNLESLNATKKKNLKMINSSVFDSKFTNLYTSTDTHQLFTNLCDKITDLQEKRMAEKLARPNSIDQKQQFMRQTNNILQSIGITMNEILDLSSLFKGKDSNIIKQNFITTQAWKSGIRKIQVKLTNFYTVKMKYFSVINESMQLGLNLVELEQKEWAKDCFSKMSGFCICG